MANNPKSAVPISLSMHESPQFWETMLGVFFEALLSGQEDYVSAPWSVRVRTLTPSNGRRGYSQIVEISCEKEPVWIMHTLGHYEKEATVCLETALRIAHQHKQWYGGRGQPIFHCVDMTYVNQWKGDFDKSFGGKESIRRGTRVIGQTITIGRSLI